MSAATLNPLLHSWGIDSPGVYVCSAVGMALGVRFILALLKASARGKGVGFWREFWIAMHGFAESPTQQKATQHEKDYWFPFYLGCIELLSYPVFIFTSNWLIIGAWITLKVAPQWKHWSEHRVAFNRFLIGTALVLAGSYVLAWIFVRA
jgi:hypothetical protein